jgi:hypothetical protein
LSASKRNEERVIEKKQISNPTTLLELLGRYSSVEMNMILEKKTVLERTGSSEGVDTRPSAVFLVLVIERSCLPPQQRCLPVCT